MELFKTARVVRLRSHHDKYLLADEDHESVCQDRDGTVRNAGWTVEFVKNSNTLRFKSCYGKYLTASNMPFRLGLRGKKVQQTLPKRLDSSLEWEPIREGCQVRLKTPYGQFLRANGGVPPWRNSITHDVPHRTTTQDWVLWDIDVIEFRPESPERRPESPEHRPVALPPPPPPPESPESRPESPERQPESPESRPVALPPPPPPPELLAEPTEPTSPSKIELRSPRTSKEKSSESLNHGSPMKGVGRMIHYHVANDKGDVEDSAEEFSFSFKGSEVEGLKKKLKEETGLEEIVACSHNPLNGKLYPIRLHLPPNNHDMHVVVVPSSSEGSDL